MMGNRGKVFLVGAGPGDPELITVKARRFLEQADVVFHDALVHPDLLKHCRKDAHIVYVGKRAGRAQQRQSEINQHLEQAARAGQMVVRLKGGDPYLFGRGSEEAEHLAQAGIEFEVVPGVPSPLAATAYAGFSLTHRDLASSVAYLTATESPQKDQSAHDWSKLATATQTLVIFMGVRKLASLMQLLIDNGRSPDCPAAVIQSASLPTQRTLVGTVATIARIAEREAITMPALTVVGEVLSLREHLRWYDKKPLFGKRVLVTRPAGQHSSLSQALRDAGADPIELPTIRIVEPEDRAPLQRAITHIAGYAWIVFTSANGVDALFREIARQGGDSRWLGRAKLAVIGSATAERLERHGVRADVMPDEHVGEQLAAAIIDACDGTLKDRRVLLPRAAVAREAIIDLLTEAGAKVDAVAAYRTLPPEPADAARLRALITKREIDVITFTSSSTVTHLCNLLGDEAATLLAPMLIASIGPITTATAKERGVRVDVTAQHYTVEGLVEALTAHSTR